MASDHSTVGFPPTAQTAQFSRITAPVTQDCFEGTCSVAGPWASPRRMTRVGGSTRLRVDAEHQSPFRSGIHRTHPIAAGHRATPTPTPTPGAPWQEDRPPWAIAMRHRSRWGTVDRVLSGPWTSLAIFDHRLRRVSVQSFFQPA